MLRIAGFSLCLTLLNIGLIYVCALLMFWIKRVRVSRCLTFAGPEEWRTFDSWRRGPADVGRCANGRVQGSFGLEWGSQRLVAFGSDK